jgi:alkylation response protein AidB-like acyl-CoA dehydrogenase
MELTLSDDQELLRSTAAKYIEDACPLTTVRELAESETGVPPNYLRQAGELGWFAMLVPEELGGGSVSGDGIRDVAAIAEERGRGLQPGPFVPMNVIADALARRGNPTQQGEILPGIVNGETVATWVTGITSPGESIGYTTEGEGFVLSGHAGPVQDGALAEWLLVTADGPRGLSQFVIPSTVTGVSMTSLRSHDITQRFSEVHLDSVRAESSQLLGPLGGAASDVDRQLLLALVLSVAETVGATDVLFEMARQYAADRIAFGRPIGSFQSVKHQLADMSLSLEAGKAISATATRAAQAGRDDATEIAHMAKAWVGDTGIDIAQGCFQVFGGIGYTWEHDSHLFLRRITMNNLLYGQPEWHREQICLRHGI